MYIMNVLHKIMCVMYGFVCNVFKENLAYPVTHFFLPVIHYD